MISLFLKKRCLSRFLFSFAVVSWFVSTAAAQHGDVLLYITGGTGSGIGITGGKLTTGVSNDGLTVNHPSLPSYDPLLETNPVLGVNVFGFDFGEDPLDPYLIGDPGFKNDTGPTVGIAPNNGVLPGNSTLTISPVSVLLYWDGIGSVDFTPAPAGVTFGFKRGSVTGLLSGTGTDAPFPTIGTTNPTTGRIHVHVESQLNFSDGSDPMLPNAPNGIYYYSALLGLSSGGVAPSDPVHFVYNNGLTEEQHDAAMAAVSAIPEPGTWALIVCGLGAAGYGLGQKMRRRLLPVA